MEIKSNGCFPGTWKCQEPNIGHSEIQKYLFRWFVITNIKQGVYQVITGLSKYNFCNLKFDVHGFVSSSLHALKRSLHFCYTFLYSSSSWQQAEPGEARFGKSWLHEPLPGASVQREIKKRCHDLIAETFPQTSLMKMFRTPCFDQTVTWFFPFGGWNGKNAQQLFKPYSNPSSQLHGKRTVPFLVVFCHPFEKNMLHQIGFFPRCSDKRLQKYSLKLRFAGTLMVACILTLSWSSTSMSSMQCWLVDFLTRGSIVPHVSGFVETEKAPICCWQELCFRAIRRFNVF